MKSIRYEVFEKHLRMVHSSARSRNEEIPIWNTVMNMHIFYPLYDDLMTVGDE